MRSVKHLVFISIILCVIRLPQSSTQSEKIVILYVAVTTSFATQNAIAVLSNMRIILELLNLVLPNLNDVTVQSDNAGAFAGTVFTLGLPRLNTYVRRPRVIGLDHNESGEGKSVLDVKFSYFSKAIASWVANGNNFTSLKDVYSTLCTVSGLTDSIFIIFGFQ